MRIELTRPDRRIVLVHRPAQRLGIKAELGRQLGDGGRGDRRLVGEDDRLQVRDPERRLVADEEGLLLLVPPDLIGQLFEGGVEAVLALVEEAPRRAVDDDSVGIGVDHRVGLG